jgi:hypothetical protein
VKVTRKTYTQAWPAYNAAQTKEKSELQAFYSMNFANLPELEQHTGTPRLALADIIFSSTYIKMIFGAEMPFAPKVAA